jgi:hypothetical protein
MPQYFPSESPTPLVASRASGQEQTVGRISAWKWIAPCKPGRRQPDSLCRTLASAAVPAAGVSTLRSFSPLRQATYSRVLLRALAINAIMCGG